MYEFLRIVTHPRVFNPASSQEDAMRTLEELSASPSLAFAGAAGSHFANLRSIAEQSGAEGNLFFDVHYRGHLQGTGHHRDPDYGS